METGRKEETEGIAEQEMLEEEMGTGRVGGGYW